MYLKSVKGKWNTVVLLAVMLVTALLFASLAGCGSSGTSGGSGKITLTDDAGNKLVLDKPADRKKPRIGDFSTPNVEKIASVNPQVVLVTGGIQKGMVESLNKLGIKVFVIDPKSFEGLFKDMEAVGVMAGIKDVAASKVEAMRKQVSQLSLIHI